MFRWLRKRREERAIRQAQRDWDRVAYFQKQTEELIRNHTLQVPERERCPTATRLVSGTLPTGKDTYSERVDKAKREFEEERQSMANRFVWERT